MDFLPNDDFINFEESLYQDLSPHGPTRARRRQSDAKWRASVATCYDTLKHVVPQEHPTSKRKISKAVILQESERHIINLENVLSRLVSSESQANGKAVLWKADGQWDQCTLKHFQEDFAERQHRIFHSSNQGRRCYNLLDEIKEEIFSMSVDPNNISVIDKDSVSSLTRCVEKVNGKEVSRFSQFPNGQLIKSKEKTRNTTTKPLLKPMDHTKHQPFFERSSVADYLPTERLPYYFDREDQIVPSVATSSQTPLTSKMSTHLSSRSSTSIPSFKSINDGHDSCDGGYTVQKGSSTLMPLDGDNTDNPNDDIGGDNGDQEVPSFENSSTSKDSGTNDNFQSHFLSYPLPRVECVDGTPTPTTTDVSIVSGQHRKEKCNFLGISPTSALSKTTQSAFVNDDSKTPANSISIETFRAKCLDSSSLFRSLTERGKNPVNKSKTARKLNFNHPECEGVHQKLSDHHHHHHQQRRGMSPMLAGFTPIKLSPKVSYCITCKRPDESLVSPWKPFHSPIYDGSKKPQDKSPMIDPDNSLFCFETLDDSAMDNKDDVNDERTPATHCVTEDSGPTNQAFKRKITCKSFDLLGKYQPKCRKKLDGLFDLGVCKPFSSSNSKLAAVKNDEAQVVPDYKFVSMPQEVKTEDDTGVVYTAGMDKDSDDAVDFDGFFFYFRQIGQQLKDQQKLSCKEIQSPSVAAKVMKMWMRLPSPDKQTIKTLALLDSQEVCPSQEGVCTLSQDLQDVDVEPIDLKEFIPNTPV